MLREVHRRDGVRVQFEYDAFARRTAKRVLAADGALQRETSFVWDGHVVVHEIDSEDGLTTWHWEPGTFKPVAKERAGRRWVIASDHLGTPTELYDEAGRVAWEMQLDVWGVARESGEAGEGACPWRWPGQYEDRDVGGLYYNNARWYDPARGEYVSSDPIGLRGGVRFHGYVEDPALNVDPWALKCARVNAQEELEIDNKFTPGTREHAEIVAFVALWNEELALHGPMSRQAVSEAMRTSANQASDAERANYPNLYAGNHAGHIPDVGWGGAVSGPFVPLHPRVNGYIGSATRAVTPGTVYRRVVLIP